MYATLLKFFRYAVVQAFSTYYANIDSSVFQVSKAMQQSKQRHELTSAKLDMLTLAAVAMCRTTYVIT